VFKEFNFILKWTTFKPCSSTCDEEEATNPQVCADGGETSVVYVGVITLIICTVGEYEILLTETELRF
jgi:hypothetical protein